MGARPLAVALRVVHRRARRLAVPAANESSAAVPRRPVRQRCRRRWQQRSASVPLSHRRGSTWGMAERVAVHGARRLSVASPPSNADRHRREGPRWHRLPATTAAGPRIASLSRVQRVRVPRCVLRSVRWRGQGIVPLPRHPGCVAGDAPRGSPRHPPCGHPCGALGTRGATTRAELCRVCVGGVGRLCRLCGIWM